MIENRYLNFFKAALVVVTAVYSCKLTANSSVIGIPTLSSSPLLYRMIDYNLAEQQYLEIEPIFVSMYNTDATIANFMIAGKSKLIFDQQGQGDLNPAWLNLLSNNTLANYQSSVSFAPSLQQSGILLHWYTHYNSFFAQVTSALIQSRSAVLVTEVGGGNGLVPGIANAQQALMQSDWNYGKIGQSQRAVGLDDIQLRMGGVYTTSSDTYDISCAGFGLVQAPTGSGTKAEWLFEPLVGTNHWGLGLGFELQATTQHDLSLMLAANYRYAIAAWETRSFDLKNCGPWSRYLGLQDCYSLPAGAAINPLPGINYLTQSALIDGKSQLNMYARLKKQFASSSFEISYNFLCNQQETISKINNLPTGFGIYALTGSATGAGGVTTAPQACINQDVTQLDPLFLPSVLSVENFDTQSACVPTYAINTLAVRLEVEHKHIAYGFGASINAALTTAAISSWSIWMQFGYLFSGQPESFVSVSDDLQDDQIFESYYDPLITINQQILSDDSNLSASDDFEYQLEQDDASEDEKLTSQTIALVDLPIEAHQGIVLQDALPYNRADTTVLMDLSNIAIHDEHGLQLADNNSLNQKTSMVHIDSVAIDTEQSPEEGLQIDDQPTVVIQAVNHAIVQPATQMSKDDIEEFLYHDQQSKLTPFIGMSDQEILKTLRAA